ncbi:DNA polymerase III chi subunit [hydrothermal vent metagenome]|uniref:DNA polymerase III chi subunit n=1 Tax=hydrothermal vent metagenome TaxID=652676 RepID=A0A3B0ZIW9_9ZZZZ
MTRIDFYILDSNTPQARESFACRLIEKVQQQGHSIFVQSHSTQHAELIDDLLWSFKPESFVAHARIDSTIAKNCSIVIGQSKQLNQEHATTADCHQHDVLINFESTVPSDFSYYNRVVEIINKTDNATTEDGRVRYAHYKDRGYKIESHNIRG